VAALTCTAFDLIKEEQVDRDAAAPFQKVPYCTWCCRRHCCRAVSFCLWYHTYGTALYNTYDTIHAEQIFFFPFLKTKTNQNRRTFCKKYSVFRNFTFFLSHFM